MNCPKCGKEMKKGWLDAKYPVIFTPSENMNTIFRVKGDVKIRGVFDLDRIEAEICEDCRCVVADY